jgi:1,2-diacylglycerol 3-beta-galactosyltransferase
LSSKQELRQKLGLNCTLPVVLVVGGGDGIGGIVEISKRLGYELGRLHDREAETPTTTTTTTKPQMVVICGKNQNAKDELERVNDWGNDIIVHMKGFVNNMDEYMKASDVLITKAGPGTIAEASICGLPCMMFSYLYVHGNHQIFGPILILLPIFALLTYIFVPCVKCRPGQEEGNIPFVENAGFGKYSNDPNVIANLVSKWISSPEELQRMQQAAYSVSRPNATLDIAKDIAGMLFQHLKNIG